MTIPADSIARDLRSLIRGDVEFDPISRRLYATDAGLSQIEPLGVVSPRDAEDVVRLVGYAAERGLSLVPRGMGSGLNGAAVGAGIQVDFTRYMNSILEVAPDASWVRVQPGVVMASLNRHLQPLRRLLRPRPLQREPLQPGRHDRHQRLRSPRRSPTEPPRTTSSLWTSSWPTAASTRPGLWSWTGPSWPPSWPATRAAGRAFAAVLPELRDNAGQRSAPACPGWSRTRAAIASRPSWTRATPGPCAAQPRPGEAARPPRPSAEALRRRRGHPGPGHRGHAQPGARCPTKRGIAMAYFPSVFAVRRGRARDPRPRRPPPCEIMDSRFLALVRKHDSRVDAMLPEHTDTALLIEFEGDDDAELDEKFAVLRRHLDSTAALRMVRATTAAETEHLWRVRKSAVALMQRKPGPRQPLPFIEDITVHPTELPASVDFLQKLFDREGVEAVMVGHVGDGNIHTRPVLESQGPGRLPHHAAHLRRGLRLRAERPRHHVGRARGRSDPHPSPPGDVRGRDLRPLHAYQEGLRSPERD